MILILLNPFNLYILNKTKMLETSDEKTNEFLLRY